MYVAAQKELREDHGPSHDALNDDEQFEIKSCLAQYSDGRIGKFHIWENQIYDRLGDGKFVLLVCLRNDRHSVIATYTIDPLALTDAGSASWIDHKTMGHKMLRKVPWPEVVPLSEIDLGARHYFSEYYPEQEQEDAFCLEVSDGQIRLYL